MENAQHETFELLVDHVIKGSTDLQSALCQFSYTWDSKSNTGIANLESINGTQVNIVLHPLGNEGQLDFMSDIEPTSIHISANAGESIAIITVLLNRVILDVDGEARTAAILLGEEGDTILTSDGFLEDSAAKQLPAVELEKQEAPEGVEPPTAE